MQHILTDNIAELNKLIYAGAKQVNNKIGIPLRNSKGNTKPGLEIRKEGEKKTASISETTEEGETCINPTERKDSKTTNAVKSDNTNGKKLIK